LFPFCKNTILRLIIFKVINFLDNTNCVYKVVRNISTIVRLNISSSEPHPVRTKIKTARMRVIQLELKLKQLG